MGWKPAHIFMGVWVMLAPAASAAFGQSGQANQNGVTLKVEFGWGERIRPGRWTPILIRASANSTRAAVVEVYASQGGTYSMLVRQHFTLNPTPTTLQVYAPVRQTGTEPTIVLRDADNGKTLASFPEDQDRFRLYEHFLDANDRYIGVSGARAGGQLQVMQGQLLISDVKAGFRDPVLLPLTPFGYDGLDLLLLHKPDWKEIDEDRQQAMVQWVRCGGTLLLWPGESPSPDAGPLIDVLPVRIGNLAEVKLEREARLRVGLAERFSVIRVRRLEPRPASTAEPILLFDSPNVKSRGPDGAIVDAPRDPNGLAYRTRLGMGRIIVAPTDLSQLQFNSTSEARGFWGVVLAGTNILPETGKPEVVEGRYWSYDRDMQQQYAASQDLMDFLGNIPGAGRFGFSYVAYVLLAMMFVVGPVDWLVLKKLGRQPWTWVTTTGWIALVTLGAVYAGHLFKSGELHYRSVQVVDQIDGQTIGEASLVCIYSPRTTDYHLDAVPSVAPAADGADAAKAQATPSSDPPPGWWQPVSPEEYSRQGLKTDVTFRQTDHANTPGAMLINVWNMRFLRAESPAVGAPAIEAKLTWHANPLGNLGTVTGTVKNLTDKPMTDIRIRTRDGFLGPPGEPPPASPQGADDATADESRYDSDLRAQREVSRRLALVKPVIARLEPGATVQFTATYAHSGDVLATREATRNRSYRYYRYNPEPIEASRLWAVAGDLAATRSSRIDSLLREGNGKVAVIYAGSEDVTPPAALREPAAKQKHYRLIRAVVPLASDGLAQPSTGPAEARP